MKQFRLSVVTSGETVFDGQVSCVNIPTGFGSVGVLKGHADMLCNLEAGILRLRCEEGTIRLRIGAGIASVEKNEVNILVSSGQILED